MNAKIRLIRRFKKKRTRITIKKKKKRNLTNLEIARLIWSPVSKLDSWSVSKDLYDASRLLLPDNWIIRCSNVIIRFRCTRFLGCARVIKRSLYPMLRKTFLRKNYLEIIIKIYIYQFILNIDDKCIYSK